jgi:hypothetical protein
MLHVMEVTMDQLQLVLPEVLVHILMYGLLQVDQEQLLQVYLQDLIRLQ